MRGFLRGVLVGAWVAYLFDPQLGRRRRHMLRDRAIATVRRGARRTRRAATLAAAGGHAVVARATHRRERPKDLSDETLTQKVLSEAFRDPHAPKGHVNVNVEHGRVILRGEVDTPDLIRDLERRVRKVTGVRDVENLLHLPGNAPPMHTAAE